VGTGNPKEQNDLTGLYPRDPLYPPYSAKIEDRML